jgi:protein SCO1/2
MQQLKHISRFVFSLGTLLALASVSASAQLKNPEPFDRGNRNQQPAIFDQVGIDQKLGAQAPLGLNFRDESGQSVQLGTYFNQKKPVILALVYYDCPMLCNQVLNGMTSALQVLKFNAGKEFDVVAVSFDPRETPELALAKRKTYLDRYKRAGAESGFHFLTGQKDAIDALTRTVGFRYSWDDKSNQFAHASALILLTPEGKVAQYYYGIEYSPKDMRLGIIEASNEKLGNVADRLLLYCYHYDPMTGKYGALVMRMVRIGGILTMVVLGGFIVLSVRRERHA